jgi:T5SS/PEP-CTERM-associated repeat protein
LPGFARIAAARDLLPLVPATADCRHGGGWVCERIAIVFGMAGVVWVSELWVQARCAPGAALVSGGEIMSGGSRLSGSVVCGVWVALLAVVMVPTEAEGVNYFRIGAGGEFRAPHLWSPWNPLNPAQYQGPGGANDTANFNLGVTPGNRYFLANVHGTNERLLVHNDSLALELSGSYSLAGTSATDASFIVGTVDGGTGDVIFSGSGSLQSQHSIIGNVAGSSGVVRVVGVGWTINAGILRVGNLGSGSLLIQNGGTVTNTSGGAISGNIGGSVGSNGHVTVAGANSVWTNNGTLSVGVSGSGSMGISGGGRVINGIGNIGTSSSGEGFVSVAGVDSRWINNGELRVGSAGTGTLNVTVGGRVQNTAGRIGVGPGSSGMATVRGANTWWFNFQTLTVGESGTGTLNIENGGVVANDAIIPMSGIVGANAGSVGTVNVTGAGAHWNNTGMVRIGQNGTGSLSIMAGGQVSNTSGVVGLNAGSSGTVTVSGTDSIWANNGMLFVGEWGDGTLTIESGGSVSSEPEFGTFAGIVAWREGSTGTVLVDGAGSTWNNNGGLSVGTFGSATLTIQNGGTVSAGATGSLGVRTGSSGTATVTGPGSAWNVSANLSIAGDFAPGGGVGTLDILNGGTVTSGAGIIANNDGSIGTVTVDGNAAWVIGGNLTVGGQVGGGGTATLNIQNGGLVRVGVSGGGNITGNAVSQITLDSGGELEVRGSIDLSGGAFNFLGGTLRTESFVGSLVNQGGTLAPGNLLQPIGTTAVSSNYTQQAGGTLEIEIGGVVPGQFDSVAVAGNAILAGTLRLSLIDGFEPLQGNSFTILETEFGNVGGKFSQVEGNLPLPGMGLAVTYGTNLVRVQTAIPGDANLDGQVTIADLGILAANWQQPGKMWIEADFNGDGMVTIADLGILAAHWQMGVGGLSSGSGVSFEEALGMFDVFSGIVVPEPATGLLLVFSSGLLRRRRS